MPVELSSQLSLHTAPAYEADWKRQRRTAKDILRRLEHQEGVILADQVGMGKTYVALAVAVSQILASSKLQQVLVLVPPAVAQKWVVEWGKFSAAVLGTGTGIRCVPDPLRSGEALLAALDDPPATRAHLLVATHTALTTSMKDSFIQLALLQTAIKGRHGVEQKKTLIARWAHGKDGLFRDNRMTEERVAHLLRVHPREWRDTWVNIGGAELQDDPVPLAVQEAMESLDLGVLRTVLDQLPVRQSKNIRTKLAEVRSQLDDATQGVWRSVLSATNLKLPLLIVDEAHRLKNDDTRISQLFAPRSDGATSGALADVFDRMLFLTATPFELGHKELTSVLSRFSAVRRRPPGLEPLETRLERLGERLQEAQGAALTLDHDWAKVQGADVHHFLAWERGAPVPDGAPASVATAWRSATQALKSRKSMNEALAPWVIRHQREHRRRNLPGSTVLLTDQANPAIGLSIDDDVVLPFLLAARAQSVASEERQGAARPLFAYGIASSFEAFGRLGHDALVRDTDVNQDDETTASRADVQHGGAGHAADWYRVEIESLLLHGGVALADHPKVKASIERAADLWLRGHKCVIFAWYVATGAALERALGARVEALVMERARAALDMPSDTNDAVRATLDRIGERLLRKDSPGLALITGHLTTFYAPLVMATPKAERSAFVDRLVEVSVRHLRRREYLVRYTHLSPELSAESLWDGVAGDNPIQVALLVRWERFARRLAEESAKERDRVLSSLLGEQGANPDADVEGGTGSGANLDPVRRAHGGTARETRERLTAVFNTPFSPELLVASSVMGEGIDLHRECRHVIHHDLDWNPSILEQRTGRLDRIGALAETDAACIDVYEPYLAGTHDEKMYLVVKDRAGWFDVVMGRASAGDERVTDAEEARLPLPAAIAQALTMKLESKSTG